MLSEAQREVLDALSADGRRLTCRFHVLGTIAGHVNLHIHRGGDVWWPLEVHDEDVDALLCAALIERRTELERYPDEQCYVITDAGRAALGDGGEE